MPRKQLVASVQIVSASEPSGATSRTEASGARHPVTRFVTILTGLLILWVPGLFTGTLEGRASAGGSPQSPEVASSHAPAPNPLQVATLRWFEANQTGPSFPVGRRPTGLVFDGANIWVANFSDNSVTKLRASDGLHLGTVPLGSVPNDLAYDGAHLWIASFNSGTVTKLRASSGAIVGIFPVESANGIAYDGTSIWVSSFFSGVVKLTTAGAVIGRFPTGSGASGVAFDGQNIWVANFLNDTVTKLRASDGTNLGTFPVATPYGLAFDGTSMWVTSRTGNSVVKLRASDGANLGAFAVGAFPRGAVFDGANIWVTNQGLFFDGNTVTKLRASDGANLGTFPVGGAPWGLAFDGANVWVANFISNTVSKR